MENWSKREVILYSHSKILEPAQNFSSKKSLRFVLRVCGFEDRQSKFWFILEVGRYIRQKHSVAQNQHTCRVRVQPLNIRHVKLRCPSLWVRRSTIQVLVHFGSRQIHQAKTQCSSKPTHMSSSSSMRNFDFRLCGFEDQQSKFWVILEVGRYIR